MLRGPEVSSQAEDRGVVSLLQQHHITAWICMPARYSSALLCLSDWRTQRWQQTASWTSSLHLHSGRSIVAMLYPRSGISAHCGLLFVFARSCHIEPVSTGPWEIYTELQVWGEAIRCAGDMLLHAHTCMAMFICVTVYTHCQSQLFHQPGFECFWMNFKQQR